MVIGMSSGLRRKQPWRKGPLMNRGDTLGNGGIAGYPPSWGTGASPGIPRPGSKP